VQPVLGQFRTALAKEAPGTNGRGLQGFAGRLRVARVHGSGTEDRRSGTFAGFGGRRRLHHVTRILLPGGWII